MVVTSHSPLMLAVRKGNSEISQLLIAAGADVHESTMGPGHNYHTILNEAILQSLWKGTTYAVGLASFFLLTGTLNACITAPARRLVMPIPYVQLIVFALWMATHDDFHVVIYNYTLTNLAILTLQCYAVVIHRAVSAPWLAGGVLVSFVAAAVQVSGVTIHQHFNHNDLYHMIQMGGMYLFYRGALLLTDR